MSKELAELSLRVSRSVVAVIDTLTQRGGFRGEELTTVGQLRDQSIQLRSLAEAAASDLSAPPEPDVDDPNTAD